MNKQPQVQMNIVMMPNFRVGQNSLLQRQCACGQHTGSGECEECRQKRERTIQRSARSATPVSSVPPIVHDVLSSPGQLLDANTRAFMEPRFGHDFSQVRVHTDERAAESARLVNALAYTVGQEVVFGAGQYAPETREGKKLISHELTHVVQQRDAIQARRRDLELAPVDTAFEMEAERIAKTLSYKEMTDGNNRQAISVVKTNSSSTTIQRYAEPEHVLLGDATAAAFSTIMRYIGSAENLLQRNRSAIMVLFQIRNLWKQKGGRPKALELLNESIKADRKNDYQTALDRLEDATPLIVNWVRVHPEAGGRLTTTIAGREHPEIAELVAADTALPPLTLEGSGVQATYGEIQSLGDIYPPIAGENIADPAAEAIHKAPSSELVNFQGTGILDITRAQVSGRATKGLDPDMAYQQATQWRERELYNQELEPLGKEGAAIGGKSYGTLALENVEHFAGENEIIWLKYHTKALEIARQVSIEQNSKTRAKLINRAYTLNAFGDHFLMDAFSAGHLFHKNKVLKQIRKLWNENKEMAMDYFVKALINDHPDTVIKLIAHRIPVFFPLDLPIAAVSIPITFPVARFSSIKREILAIEKENPLVILNAALKVMHDFYNENGILVCNRKGDCWRTFGDDYLKRSATTWQLAALAGLRSRVDVTETLHGKRPLNEKEAWNYTPMSPENIDKVALMDLQTLIMRPQNNKLADLFSKKISIIEYTKDFEVKEKNRAKEAKERRVPQWDQLPPDTQKDLKSRNYDEMWFKEHDPEIRLTVLNLYVKLSGLKPSLWKFVDDQINTKPGVMTFMCLKVASFKETLRNRSDFTSPEKSPDEWSSREIRATGQLHFKHFKGWPEDKVEAHIDQAGLLLSSKWWWLFPPIPLIQMARHGLSYESYKDVYSIRKLLLAQGWYREPLVGIPPVSGHEQQSSEVR